MTCDEALAALRDRDRVMDREELDARNSDQRPETYEEVVARVYNDPDIVFYTEVLPDLHADFADCTSLEFAEMPGGNISAEDVKKKIGEARVNLMQVRTKSNSPHFQWPVNNVSLSVLCTAQMITAWEASGNGFGQRTNNDSQFGHFDLAEQTENGDNRGNFVQSHLGQRVHHLYLWHLTDKMGVLQNVLNILSSDVGADGDNVRTNSSEVQNRRRRRDEEETERAERKQFRLTVGASLTQLAKTNQHMASTAKESSIREEEGTLLKMKVDRLKAIAENDRARVSLYDELIDHHQARIYNYCEELTAMKTMAGILNANDGNDDSRSIGESDGAQD